MRCCFLLMLEIPCKHIINWNSHPPHGWQVTAVLVWFGTGHCL